MQRLWLVRHGQSTANATGVAEEPARIGLSDSGLAQAQAFVAVLLQRADALGERPSALVVSSFLRTVQTATPVADALRLPLVVGPHHHEFVYLPPALCIGLDAAARRPLVDAYWTRADAHHRVGAGAETFAEFAARLAAFTEWSATLHGRWPVVFGHGQFFAAWLLAACWPYDGSSAWLSRYRADEVALPIAHTTAIEVLRVTADEVLSAPHFSEYMGDDAETLAALRSLFTERAAGYAAAIADAVRASDLAALRHTLHQIAPSLQLLAPAGLATCLQRAQAALREATGWSTLSWTTRADVASVRFALLAAATATAQP